MDYQLSAIKHCLVSKQLLRTHCAVIEQKNVFNFLEVSLLFKKIITSKIIEKMLGQNYDYLILYVIIFFC